MSENVEKKSVISEEQEQLKSVMKDASENQNEAFNKKMEELDKRYEALIAKSKEAKYEQQVYPDDSSVEIKGLTFAEILNNMTINRQIMFKIAEVAEMITDMAGSVIAQQAELSLDLMEKHLDNVDNGITEKVKK